MLCNRHGAPWVHEHSHTVGGHTRVGVWARTWPWMHMHVIVHARPHTLTRAVARSHARVQPPPAPYTRGGTFPPGSTHVGAFARSRGHALATALGASAHPQHASPARPAPRVARTRAGRAEPAFPAAFAASGAAAAPRLVGLGPRDGNFLTLPQQQVGPPDTRVPHPTPSSCSWVPSCMPGCPGRAHPNAWVLTCPSLQGLIRWLMSGAQVTAPHTTPCPAPAAKLGGTGGTGPPPSCLTRLVAQSNET